MTSRFSTNLHRFGQRKGEPPPHSPILPDPATPLERTCSRWVRKTVSAGSQNRFLPDPGRSPWSLPGPELTGSPDDTRPQTPTLPRLPPGLPPFRRPGSAPIRATPDAALPPEHRLEKIRPALDHLQRSALPSFRSSSCVPRFPDGAQPEVAGPPRQGAPAGAPREGVGHCMPSDFSTARQRLDGYCTSFP